MGLWDEVEEEINSSTNSEVTDSNQTIKEIAQEVQFDEELRNELLESFILESGILNSSTENRYLKNPIYGMRFLSKFFIKDNREKNELESSSDNLKTFLKKDFLKFLNSITIKNSAELFQKLLDVQAEMEEYLKFQELVGKRVVGVGGSFSAGKSSFVNAILNSENDVLPADTRPTTSIPTYIVQGEKDTIFTFNQDGEKSEIDREGILAISHEFNEIYGFGLTSIIKNIVINSKNMPYDNIAFLDTPGYSKADGKEETDKELALSHLKNIDSLIWLIDIDNGTIRQSDIDFIKSLKLSEDVEILFILNKADKKPKLDVLNILHSTRKFIAEESGISNKFEITAYSSIDRQEFGGQKIDNFLTLQNGIYKTKLLYSKIIAILKEFEVSFKEEIKEAKVLTKTFNQLDIYSETGNLEFEELEEFEKVAKSKMKNAKQALESFEQIKQELFKVTEVFMNHENEQKFWQWVYNHNFKTQFPATYEEALKVKKLDLSNSNLDDISILKNLRDLEELNLANNQISNLSVLENFPNLKKLNLENNRISTIDLLLRQSFHFVQSIFDNNNRDDKVVSKTHLFDISSLENLSNLEELNLSNNQIEDIAPLEDLVNLKILNLSNNQIEDIDSLAILVNLEQLDLSKNIIENISILDNLNNLKQLDVSNNKISDIAILQQLDNKLSVFNATNNSVEFDI